MEAAKLTIECGRLNRGSVRRAIKASVPIGLSVDIDEDFGMLDGVFIIRASGDGAGRWLTALQRTADQAGRSW